MYACVFVCVSFRVVQTLMRKEFVKMERGYCGNKGMIIYNVKA